MSRIDRAFPALLASAILAAVSAAPQSASGQAAPALNDAEIAAVVVAANQIDAELGDLAVARSANPSVQTFGRSMGADHRGVNKSAGELLQRLGVTPAENALSRKLRADAAEVRRTLEAKTGADFDAAYIAHEIAYHQAVIDAVDQVLVPAVTNAELKSTLLAVRPALVAHLRHAEQLRDSLKPVAP